MTKVQIKQLITKYLLLNYIKNMARNLLRRFDTIDDYNDENVHWKYIQYLI